MPKTPDKTINEKFVAFKYRFNELIKEFKEENLKKQKFSPTDLVENAKKQALEEMECHLRYEDDVMAVGNTVYFKSKIFFFDASGVEISAQSIAERIVVDYGNEKTLNAKMNKVDFTEFSRRWAFYALLGLSTNSKPIKNKELPEELATMTYKSIYDYAYEQAYKQALEDVKNDAELPFSNLSEEKKTELMIKNCPAPVQTPDFKGEYESGGVPKGFKGFN